MFIPVDPTTTSDGALAALVPQLGEEAAKPVKLSNPKGEFSHFQVVSDALSASAVSTLGVGSSVSGSLKATDKFFYFDAITFTDQYEEEERPDKVIYATRWGIGLRVLLRVSDITTTTSLNFALVGAAVELGQARAQYTISGFGIGTDGLNIVLKHVPALGDFKYETYLKLNKAVVALSQHIEDNKANLIPKPVAVALRKTIDPLENARSIYYAIRHIANCRSLNYALSQAKDVYNDNIIRSIYSQFLQIDSEAAQPSKDAQKKAENWLNIPGVFDISDINLFDRK